MAPSSLLLHESDSLLSLNEYQAAAASTAIYPESEDIQSIIGLSYTALGLAGEAGEISNKVKKILRDNDGVITGVARTQIISELGDVLWYVALTARQLGFPLETVANWNVQKLGDRAARGALQGSGDAR